MTNTNIKYWVIEKRVFDNTGDFIDVVEVKRFHQVERPDVKLGKDEALFKVTRFEAYDKRLSYPAAHGLSNREGV